MQTPKSSANSPAVGRDTSQTAVSMVSRLLGRLPEFNRSAIIGTVAILAMSAVALILVQLLAGLNEAVNVSGRQRMFSQRMAKAVEMVAAEAAQGERADAARKDLAEVMVTFDKVLTGFEHEHGEVRKKAAAVRSVWDGFRSGAEQVMAGGDDAAAGLATVRRENLKLLAASHALVGALSGRADRFKMAAAATLLVGLMAGGVIVVFLWRDGRRQEAQVVAIADAEAGRREEQRQALLIKTALDGVAVNVMMADRDYNIIYANDATLTTLGSMEAELRTVYPGFRASALVGSNTDVFHRNPKAVRKILDDPARLPYTTQIHVGPFVLNLAVSAVIDGQGEYVAAVVAWEDVTERVTMEEETTRIVQGVTEGALDQRVDVGRFARPEYQTQAELLNEMLATIAAPLRRILDTTQQVTLSTGEIAAGNQDLASRTEEQAASLEETASAMEEMASTTRATAEKAIQANELAATAQHVAEEGGDVVGKAVDAMTAINQSSTRISDIIEVIDEIAFQTNLLSLNAAVEAARAGEQGRGFAVVAAEVRNLARRSAKAAQEIKGLIQDSVAKVAAGTELVNASGASLNGILQSVCEVTAFVEDIASASREQSTGIDAVNEAIGQMNSITQQNAALVEQVAASADALTARARDMEKQVQQFRLGDDPDGGARHSGSVSRAPQVPEFASQGKQHHVEAGASTTAVDDEWEDF